MAADGVRHVSDDERRARIAPRHGIAPGARLRRPGRRDRGDDGAPRHRAGDRLPLAARPRRRPHGRRRRPGVLRASAAWSSSWPCAAPSSSSRATCCRRRGGARRPGSPPSSGPGWPRTSSGAGSPTTAPRGSTGRAPPCSPGWPTAASCRPRHCARSCPSSRAASTSPSARPTAPTSRCRRGCSPSSASRGWSPAAATAATGASPDRSGRRWRPGWASVPEPWKAAEGWAELVRRWLWTFGPGTAADIQWWLGGTVGIVKQALADVDAVPVSLDGGGDTGWLLPDDLEPVTHDEPWVALLPVLDPTVMGWKSRGFYLDARPRAAPVRQQRQRRHHRVGRRTRRRLLGAGRRRRRRGPLRRDGAEGRPARPRRRGGAVDGVARRRPGRHGLPVRRDGRAERGPGSGSCALDPVLEGGDPVGQRPLRLPGRARRPCAARRRRHAGRRRRGTGRSRAAREPRGSWATVAARSRIVVRTPAPTSSVRTGMEASGVQRRRPTRWRRRRCRRSRG